MGGESRSGIPTIYRDIRFRSRLEAKWAGLFDLLRWTWVYEPIDAEGYIPDFLVEGDLPIFVEVGPCSTAADYQEKSAKPDAAVETLRRDTLVVGVNALPRLTYGWKGTPPAGWLGQFWEHDSHDPSWCLTGCEARTAFSWDVGVWTTCVECGSVGVVHASDSYTVRPCGHYPGGRINDLRTDVSELWARAANRVQWMGRASTVGRIPTIDSDGNAAA